MPLLKTAPEIASLRSDIEYNEARRTQIFDLWTQKTTLLMNELLQKE